VSANFVVHFSETAFIHRLNLLHDLTRRTWHAKDMNAAILAHAAAATARLVSDPVSSSNSASPAAAEARPANARGYARHVVVVRQARKAFSSRAWKTKEHFEAEQSSLVTT
jgi:hypothetical protein